MKSIMTIKEFNDEGNRWRLAYLSTRPIIFKIGNFTVEQKRAEEQPGKLSPWHLFRVFAGTIYIGKQSSYPDKDNCSRMLEEARAQAKGSGDNPGYELLLSFNKK